MLVVDGVVGPAYSTLLGRAETLPFILLSKLSMGVLSSVAVQAALTDILESPALKAFEGALHGFLGASRGHGVGERKWVHGAVGAVSV